MPDVRNDDAMAELYASDAGLAVQVLNDVLENGGPGEFLIALRQLTSAFGGVQAVAEGRTESDPVVPHTFRGGQPYSEQSDCNP